jgi:hypothetical protein
MTIVPFLFLFLTLPGSVHIFGRQVAKKNDSDSDADFDLTRFLTRVQLSQHLLLLFRVNKLQVGLAAVHAPQQRPREHQWSVDLQIGFMLLHFACAFLLLQAPCTSVPCAQLCFDDWNMPCVTCSLVVLLRVAAAPPIESKTISKRVDTNT